MKCPNEEKLAALAAEDLPQEEQEKLREHLERCPSCQADHTRYQDLLTTLNERETPEVHSDFVQRVMNEAEYRLHEERRDRTTGADWSLPRISGFIRRNAPWIASLSLHCSLILLILLLVINRFTGTETRTPQDDVMTGVPVMSTDDDPDEDAYRKRIIWRGRLRALRTGGTTSDKSPCPDDPKRSGHLERIYRKLVSARSEPGFWTDEHRADRVQTTALAVLALLRGGHAPGGAGNGPSTAVREGLSYLTDRQLDSGRIGPEDAPFTTHATATAALLEASLISGSPGHRRNALDALDYLAQTVTDNIDRTSPGYWCFVSLKLGENLGHPGAGQLLRDPVLTVNKNANGKITPDLMVLPFLPSTSPDNQQKKRLRSVLDRWRESLGGNGTDLFQSDDPLALAHLIYTMDDPETTWTDLVRQVWKHVRINELAPPSRIARLALFLQTCRSYPR